MSAVIYKNIIIFTDPSTQAGYDTRSIFKWSLTGLNSEFSFSQTSCLIKAEEPSLPYYLPIAGGRIFWFIPLQKHYKRLKNRWVRLEIWVKNTNIGGKVHRLTKILLWSMTKRSLFFNSPLLAVHMLLSSVLWCLEPCSQKSHQQPIWCHYINFSAHPHILWWLLQW